MIQYEALNYKPMYQKGGKYTALFLNPPSIPLTQRGTNSEPTIGSKILFYQVHFSTVRAIAVPRLITDYTRLSWQKTRGLNSQ